MVDGEMFTMKGSYTGECDKKDCAMGGSLKRKRPYQQRCRDGFLIDDDAERSRSSGGCNGTGGGSRRRSNNGCSRNGHADVNGHAAAEMIDNVESSV